MKTSLQIAAEARLEPIAAIAERLGLPVRYLEPYGRYRGKIDLTFLDDYHDRPLGRYVLVSAITPTPLGEGKTTTAIGLAMALNRIGKRAAVTLRQSSLGPVFGIKGGGAGGGYSQIVPLVESILHLNGDIHAVSQAHNQLAALTDNSWYHGNPLDIDPDRIEIRRVVDVNDRFLRQVMIGLGGKQNGFPRQTGFDISVASELMAILAMVNGVGARAALRDLRSRIGRMVVAFRRDGTPITAEDVRGAGAATVLMREALKPNLMQTIENTPALIHAGPFANIAQGNSSILADLIALRCADYVVTEAGFGVDIGAEKFFNLKCRASGLWPDVAVIVATIRALKAHSGKYDIVAGKPLPPALLHENPDDVISGGANLRRQIENLHQFKVPVIVALNAYPEDTPAEIDAVAHIATTAGAAGMAVSNVYAAGSAGGVDLARLVIEIAERPGPRPVQFLYPLEWSLADKITTIAHRIYGAAAVTFSPTAAAQLAALEDAGFGNLPICMAKTHLSLSHDPALRGAPEGFTFPIREVRLSAGAGFILPIAGTTVTMPGLGAHPAAHQIDIDDEGNIVGLF
ncbi:MAG TPA: formate--tetrahydrofolate ligase [Chloroflexus aurantiacus]|jgi:formate--tetrahydrofolate ligase|uniref:Formate--tetrahydrofolate ligase n=2 Tax=Chloroflexus aurantiacus TaxID=1108 RepID=FTHS_CHLAA|nr:formate--tetrahydrofolate ligase [Chloroflexus aurantiacus]A9WIW3.1 RecName: Full=Formate--tetrahydrofolate ligase; AltName: Full=Formyltetrahydrofolate synthetase; Short=FHS; Short=FTHFS [Chloroflexus aurantiacus J-10-fl]B9LKW0.1 RecName: Full=Formate--tetrahydrofolate ligase; AltName: Full=Formyltetrahydrofolate synthetase; Short=FHS; Short=FTHFS [Chloroflexus aurantiacus Y-400-fl]RMG51694.1 MAG: formate--tetrahydrofolate ligase [Chloroflexota bacterium]GIV91678.1 MAG: formate--tetrahydrof